MSSGKQREDLSLLATVGYMNFSEVFYTISTSINHFATQSLGVTIIEYSMIRNGINFLIVAGILTVYRMEYFQGLNRNNFGMFFLRAIFGATAFYTFTATYKLLPLVIGATLISTSSLMTPLCAYLFLGEPVSAMNVYAIVLSFIGIVVISYGKAS